LRGGKAAAILNGVTAAISDTHRVNCLLGAWLVKARNPVRFVAAELLAMADDGLLSVQADNVGYTVCVHGDPDQLGPGRRAMLAGLGRGDSEMLLPRPPDDPDDDGRMKGSLLSADSLVTAVAREGEATGMASRAGWLLVGAGIAGLCGVIASFLLGASVVGYVLIACIGLLATWWNARLVQPSRKGRAEQGRLLALRELLSAEADVFGPVGPVPPSWHLAWSLLLLSNDEFTGWLLRHARSAPAWWTWTDETPPEFLSHQGIFGFILAVRYSMCP
jgi:hypothetical protein